MQILLGEAPPIGEREKGRAHLPSESEGERKSAPPIGERKSSPRFIESLNDGELQPASNDRDPASILNDVVYLLSLY